MGDRSESTTPVGKAVYLHDVNVDPRLQRTGIGRQLIERAKTVARDWPVDAIRLDAFDGRSGATFYAKCGFTEVGRAVYRGVPLIYFERAERGTVTLQGARRSRRHVPPGWCK